MAKWSGKYVIGLTGNIGTGKSVVRRMLEHLGAYGIDADALAHRAIAKGAPGYKPVVDMFGHWILDPDKQINRARLGKIIFTDSAAMETLEGIVHPLVFQAVDIIVQRATQKVVVLEAIKLLESSLSINLDSVWVTYTPQEIQISRLMKNRKMTEAEARMRIRAQAPQEQKAAAADVVIKNAGSFEDTWKQVTFNWQRIFPNAELAPAAAQPIPAGNFSVMRAGPRNSIDIAGLYSRLSKNPKLATREDIMAAFGEKAFMLLKKNDQLVGVIGWQVENLVARSTDLLIDPSLPLKEALNVLIGEVERSSKDLQCEASLIFVNPEMANQFAIWKSLGYDQRTPASLDVQAWQEAATETMPPESVMLFKQLRVDRVLRPI